MLLQLTSLDKFLDTKRKYYIITLRHNFIIIIFIALFYSRKKYSLE